MCLAWTSIAAATYDYTPTTAFTDPGITRRDLRSDLNQLTGPPTTSHDIHLPHTPSPEVRLRVRRDGQRDRGSKTERQTLRARVELDQDQLVGERLSLYREAGALVLSTGRAV